MGIKRYHATDTGNSVANYHEDVVNCDTCNGSGVVQVQEEAESGIIYKVEVACPNCNGKGTITERY